MANGNGVSKTKIVLGIALAVLLVGLGIAIYYWRKLRESFASIAPHKIFYLPGGYRGYNYGNFVPNYDASWASGAPFQLYYPVEDGNLYNNSCKGFANVL